jgi:lipoprotein-releasing system ATP-binding protein
MGSPHFQVRSTPVATAPASRGGGVQLSARGITKSYRKGPCEVPVLRGVDLEVREGEFLSIVGQSGCGKSTLLHILGTLDRPDAGELRLSDVRIDNLPASRRDLLRNRYFGMIFQFYHLLPELTAVENVLTPVMIGNGMLRYLAGRHKHVARAKELLDMVGLSHRLKHRPSEMSGGEMQRAAIARALINEPEVLLADEPTGNLDHASGQDVLAILRSLNESRNLTIVMVTHDDSIAHGADRCVRLKAGLVEYV